MKSVPPSVNEITKLIKNLTAPHGPSASIIKSEAKKIQKQWQALGELQDFSYLPSPRRAVINGTGILLHTNLGRAPLGQAIIHRISQLLAGYVDLEIDLASGERGSRTHYLDALFKSFVPNYEPTWVNNGAAAVLLALNTLKKATGFKRIIISRGELVEIGGGFRIPEIMEEAGLKLVEVGTTNKTRLSDYKSALKDEPAIVGKIHPSNFTIQGFTESVDAKDLVPICEKYECPLFFDAGTMTPEELRQLQPGMTCITISTDKTLGAAQGGLLMAPEKWHKKILKNPLYRAMRLDKVSLTALEVAFEALADKKERSTLPFFEMLHTSREALQTRAQELLGLNLSGFRISLVESTASIGGGYQGEEFPSLSLRVECAEASRFNPTRLAELFRQGEPSVLTSMINSGLEINLLTVLPWQVDLLKEALAKLDTRMKSEGPAN